jgi:hypothetical protein
MVPTLDKIPAGSIIPPDMVTLIRSRRFLNEPVGLPVFNIGKIERACTGSLFLCLHEEKCSNFLA